MARLKTDSATDERLWMLETNLDDASPQIIGHVMDRVFELGALDCFFTPVQMKKNRPGVLLSVLCGRRRERSGDEVVVYGNDNARCAQL